MGDSEESLRPEELAEIYRVEKKSGSLMNVRPDFYKSVALLLRSQRMEYERQLSTDPDSINCEGSNARRRKGLQLSKEIIEMRMAKICKMALRGAMGAENTIDALTPEEKDYYEKILAISKDHKSIINRQSGNISYKTQDITQMPTVKVEIPKPEPIPVPAVVEEPTAMVETQKIVPAEIQPAPAIEEANLDTVPEEGEFGFDDIPEQETEQEIPDDMLDQMVPTEEKKKEEGTIDSSESIVVRILSDVGEVSGPIRNYKLEKENVLRMSSMLAQALINRGLAKEIKMSS